MINGPTHIHTNLLATLLLLTLAGSSSFGQTWADKMLDHTTYDFGAVARGAKAEHVFIVENIYEEDMYISSVRSTCSCTTPTVDKQRLKTWEKARITAALDTRTFFGQKDATITVVFAGQFTAEVRLHVHAYIRRDVVVQPEKIFLGSVPQGSTARQKVTVDYAGQSDWRIVEVQSASPYLQGQVTEIHRSGGRVTYELYATLKDDAPAGYIREHLVLITSDPNPRTARIPVAVEGVVVPAVTVQPSPLSGAGAVGETVSMRLFVQSKQPFKIVGVRCDDQRFKSAVQKTSDNLYLVLVTFTAGQLAEEVNETIRIDTDLPAPKTLEVPVHVKVTAPG